MEEVILLLKTLLRHWLKLIVLPLLAMVAIYAVIRNNPQTYKTESKLYLNLEENKSLSLSEEGFKQYQIHSYFQNIKELLQSVSIVNRVKLKVVRSGIESYPLFKIANEELVANKEAVLDRINSLEASGNLLDETHPIDKLMIDFLDYHKLNSNNLKDMVNAYRLSDSNFLKFELRADLPMKTKILADFFIAAMIEENKRIIKTKVDGQQDLLEKLLAEAKANLDAKMSVLEAYKVDNSIINLGEHTKAIVTYLVEVEGEKAKLLSRMAAAKNGKDEILRTASLGNEMTVDLSQNKRIVDLKEELKALNRKKLVASIKAQNVDVNKMLDARISEVSNQIKTELQTLAHKTSYDPTRIQLEMANRYLVFELDEAMIDDMINVLNGEVSRLYAYAKKFAPHESRINNMEREIATAEQSYLLLLNKLNLANTMASASGENVIEIIDNPFVPERPEPSKKLIIVAAGGVGTFTMIAAILIIMALLDASITTVQRFERNSALTVSSAIPFLFPSDFKKPSGSRLIHDQQLLHLAKIINTQSENGDNVFIFLSGQQNEGKHYIARQLKRMINSKESPVSLINADWSKKFTQQSEDDLKNGKKTLVENNNILKNQHKIKAQIDELSKKNHAVFVVVPPTNLMADYHFWLENYPNVIYVFRAGRVRNAVDDRLEEFISSEQVNLLGTVLNQMDVDAMEDFVGEVPRRRSKVRVIIKRILRRDF